MGIIQRQGFKGMIGTYIGFVLGYVNLLILYPYFLEPEEIGLMRVFIDIGLILGTLSLFGSSASMNRFFPVFKDKDPEKLSGMFSFFMIISLLGTAAVTLAFYLNQETFIRVFGKNMSSILPFFNWIIPCIGLNAIIYLMEGLAAIRGRITLPVLTREVVLRLSYVVLVFLYAKGYIDFDQFLKLIPAVLALQLIILLVYVQRLRVSFNFNFMFFLRDKSLRKEFTIYSVFLLTSVLAGIFINKIDFFMLGSMKGARDTGIYSIAYYIGIVVSIPIRNLKQITRPIVADLTRREDRTGLEALYKDASINMIILSMLIFQLIWFNVDGLYELMPNGETFVVGKSIVFIICFAYLVQVSIGVGEMIMSFSNYYFYGLLYSLLSIVIAIVSNLILIPKYGMEGAALGTLFTSIISIGVILIVNKVKGKLFPFDKRAALALLLFMLLVVLDWFIDIEKNVVIINGIKSILLLSLFVIMAYKWRLSPHLNELLVMVLKKIGINVGAKD